MDFASRRIAGPWRLYLTISLCMLLSASGCAQLYGKYARRGTDIVIRTEGVRPPLEYQILLVPLPDAKPKFSGFKLNQPILTTSETSFMFAVGEYVIRYRCGTLYKDREVKLRTGSSSQVLILSCEGI